MLKDVYDPLTEYVNVFHKRFRDVAKKTFAELAEEAHVDVEANRATCSQLYATEDFLSSVKSRIRWWTATCVLSWIAAVGGIILLFVKGRDMDSWLFVLIGLVVLSAIPFLFMKVYPMLKSLKSERSDLSETLEGLKKEAWGQMFPLNRLYDWDVLTRMMTQTVPRLEFDPYFTMQRLVDLQRTYGWDGSFNAGRSVLYSHSGLINGNPFVICRTRKMHMRTKVYYGTKQIHWTTRERGANGRYETVHHSETLTASVTAPFPMYFEKTRLIYGNTAAPDLVFSRKQNGLAGNEDSLSFKWKRRQLRKKARDLDDSDFAMMTNEDFEVAFNTSDRNNNQQFALLFTPLAQESMMKLLEDEEVGFGDDFDFYKNRMINTIIPDHIQELDLDLNPAQYRHFDYDRAEKEFYYRNAHYFRAIYFSLAPLLCVPMYQQIRPREAIYGRNMQRHSAFWEHEALANFWGQDKFKHPSCVTDCILKTEQRKLNADDSVLTVYAYGYRVVRRVTHISKWGRDGRSHDVPVYWDEYLPVTGTGEIYMTEDNHFDDTSITHRERLSHIRNVLDQTHLNLYRRHIASRI